MGQNKLVEFALYFASKASSGNSALSEMRKVGTDHWFLHKTNYFLHTHPQNHLFLTQNHCFLHTLTDQCQKSSDQLEF